MDSTLSGRNSALQKVIARDVAAALAEDVGNGDLTASLIAAELPATATIISRDAAVICGMPWAEHCFRAVGADIRLDWQVAEGDSVVPGQLLCKISGNARAILTAERCALNFLQLLSATATLTRRYVDAVNGTGAQIFDTRKTLPGLRLAQKYAVSAGGGMNQRLGLYDGILIKENHIAAAGSIDAALEAARRISRHAPVQIEVETLAQLEIALEAGARLILLDNFSLQQLHSAVAHNAGRAVLEASGGIDLDNVREVALTGVQRISIGNLTKNVEAVDLSMRFTS